MWRKQTRFVCFHNLLVDHLRPQRAARPAVQLRQEAGAGDKAAQRAQPATRKRQLPSQGQAAVETCDAVVGAP